MFNNKTRNQHYVSQVEQKLNCIDSSMPKEKRRIYQFESINRESQEYVLSDERGVKIEKNLSFDDLYSLEILDDTTRDNFEQYFSKLESKIEELTKEVLASEQLDKDILLTLFNAKLINVIRNPYCILSTINTYFNLCNYTPVDQNLAHYFGKIDTLEVPESVLSEFSINKIQFRKWLKIIFYMVVPIKLSNGNYLNFASEIIKNIFNPENMCIEINLAIHEREVCLLSDRGHVDFSKAIQGNGFGYQFNLTKNAFINFSFIENNLDNLNEFLNIPEELLTIMKKRGMNKLDRPILRINKFINEDSLFRVYNSRIMYQCHKHFYAANTEFLK